MMQNDVHTFARRYIALNGAGALEEYLLHLREEFDALRIPGLPEVNGLWECPAGSLPAEYAGAAGKPLRLLEKDAVYWAAKPKGGFDGETRYLLVAGTDFLLVAMEREEGLPPELLLWKRR